MGMTDKRFSLGDYSNGLQELIFDDDFVLVELENAEMLCDLLNNLHEENKSKDSIIKGQTLEIVRLHTLADNMSGVLRELGIYDVYDDKQIMKIKEKL